jgi:hypothetical protein
MGRPGVEERQKRGGSQLDGDLHCVAEADACQCVKGEDRSLCLNGVVAVVDVHAMDGVEERQKRGRSQLDGDLHGVAEVDACQCV